MRRRCRSHCRYGLTWGADYQSADHLQHEYVLNVQRSLGKSTTLEAGYNGSQSRQLANLINARSRFRESRRSSRALPYPEFGAAESSS